MTCTISNRNGCPLADRYVTSGGIETIVFNMRLTQEVIQSHILWLCIIFA
nr:MAG TPA: hypothetical protein [Caudoviricetes sp.]